VSVRPAAWLLAQVVRTLLADRIRKASFPGFGTTSYSAPDPDPSAPLALPPSLTDFPASEKEKEQVANARRRSVAGAKARARGELYRTKLARTQAQQEREQRRMGQQAVTDDDADLLLLPVMRW
jgi:hypothetical protein